MGYYLSQNLGESMPLPLLVVDRLQQAPADGVRIALYILKTGSAVQSEICAALGLLPETVEKALLFWAGAGLIHETGTVETPVQRRRLTHGQVAFAAQNNPDIAGIITTAQAITGGPLSPADTAILITLHMEDGLPEDLILAALAHFTGGGKSSVRYTERRLLSLATEGVDNLLSFEIYLRQEEMRRERRAFVASLLGLDEGTFTAAATNSIDLWYEGYGYGDGMVEQAALRCGLNNTVKYMNGILRNWYKTGVRTPAEIPDTGANIAPTAAKTAAEDDFVALKGYAVPKLKTRK